MVNKVVLLLTADEEEELADDEVVEEEVPLCGLIVGPRGAWWRRLGGNEGGTVRGPCMDNGINWAARGLGRKGMAAGWM